MVWWVLRGIVDRVTAAAASLQLRTIAGVVLPGVEHFEPQGVHFRPPADAHGVISAPGGQIAAAVAHSVSGDAPTDSLADGEGGLHLLGTFKVFLHTDGTISLGQATTSDFVALASKVDAELTSVKADITSLNALLISHFHTGVMTGPGVTGPSAAFSSYTPHTPASTASTKVGAA